MFLNMQENAKNFDPYREMESRNLRSFRGDTDVRTPVFKNRGVSAAYRLITAAFFLFAVPQLSAEDMVQMMRPTKRMSAPAFEGSSLEGEPVFSKNYSGKIILINFWASWCIPCRKELPSLQNLQNAFPEKEFLILTVAVDRNRSAIQKIKESLNIQMPVIMDPDEVIAKKYEIQMLPITYLIGRDGKFIGKFTGERVWDSAQFKTLIQNEIQK